MKGIKGWVNTMSWPRLRSAWSRSHTILCLSQEYTHRDAPTHSDHKYNDSKRTIILFLLTEANENRKCANFSQNIPTVINTWVSLSSRISWLTDICSQRLVLDQSVRKSFMHIEMENTGLELRSWSLSIKTTPGVSEMLPNRSWEILNRPAITWECLYIITLLGNMSLTAMAIKPTNVCVCVCASLVMLCTCTNLNAVANVKWESSIRMIVFGEFLSMRNYSIEKLGICLILLTILSTFP